MATATREDSYEPKIGDRWKRNGPVGDTRVQRVMLPGAPNYDGGAPGVSVRIRQFDGSWKDYFVLAASADDFAQRMSHQGKSLVSRGVAPQEGRYVI